MTRELGGALWRGFAAVVREAPERDAIVCGERAITFRQLHTLALRAAGQLATSGLGPGDRCLLWVGNSAEAAAAMLACWQIGAIVALVNDEAPATHFEHAIRLIKPSLAIVESQNFQRACQCEGPPVIELPDWKALPIDTDAPRNVIHDNEPASIFFTSGSTGMPKGVVQSHSNLVRGCRMVAEALELRKTDRILCPIPWSFDYGYGQFLSTILLGLTQVLPVARNPFSLCEAIDRHRPTVFAGLPSIFALLIRGLSPIRTTDLSSLRLVTNTGGKISPAIFQELLQLFGHCEISLNYGMTETYRGAGLPTHLASKFPESVGFAYPGVSISVLGPDGEEAPPGQLGEIVHRGTGVFLGYWADPVSTAAVLRPDPLWRHEGVSAPLVVFSGDMGWKDEQGLLYIKGRRDRLIKSMGVRVSPDEIEAVIRGNKIVQDVAIVGVDHEIIGEMVAAAVVLKEGSDSKSAVGTLKAYARDCMSNFMQPRLYIVIDAIPLTPNGKPDYRAVKTLFK